ncbi:GNAT family N-acetyltransferase [Chryseomicrobium palamuruense]|uniref:GNAT family N-acetyltransferase n=1 Tax=Chryseomicrobium palamuruense TaxID=682973 RepID=A0ABV8UWM1_9BACL
MTSHFSDWLSRHGSVALLKGLRSWSELDREFSKALQESCQASKIFHVPVLQVTEDALDEYYFARKRKHHTLRRREKKLEKIGKVELVELQVSEFEQMVAVHQKRWQTRRDTSGLMDPKKQAWLKSVWQQGGESFQVHTFGLKIEEQVIAFQYDFEMADGVIGYWTGFDSDYSKYAPGFLLLEKSLRHWKAKGKTLVDFSVGYEAYKEQWASREEYTETILCSPHKWKFGYQRFLFHQHLIHRLKSSPEVVQWVRNHGKILKWIR